jgi:hypothetical protein
MNTALYQTLHRRARKLFYSRKDIAMLVSGSLDADAVRRNERAWGLDVARRDLNKRLVVYDAPIAVQQMSLRGLLPGGLVTVLVSGISEAFTEVAQQYGPQNSRNKQLTYGTPAS